MLGGISEARTAESRGGSKPSLDPDEWQRKVSNSVVRDVTDILAKLAADSASGEQYRLGAFAARTLFNHLQEIGFTASQERALASTLIVPEVQIPLLADAIQSRGIEIPGEIFTRMASMPAERVEAARAYIEKHGMHAVLMEAAALLDRVDPTRPASATSNGRFRFEALDYMEDWCRGADMVSDALTLIAVLNGAACAFGCAPCCLIAIGVGVFVAVFDLAVDYIC